MLIFRIDYFKWGVGGLNVTTKFFENGRQAMDAAYALDWDVVKIYENGVLYHEETKNESYYAYT